MMLLSANQISYIFCANDKSIYYPSPRVIILIQYIIKIKQYNVINHNFILCFQDINMKSFSLVYNGLLRLPRPFIKNKLNL